MESRVESCEVHSMGGEVILARLLSPLEWSEVMNRKLN
jgi:hypothetical protein